jgi:hypothetical protein
LFTYYMNLTYAPFPSDLTKKMFPFFSLLHFDDFSHFQNFKISINSTMFLTGHDVLMMTRFPFVHI